MRVIGQVFLAMCVSGTPALMAQAPEGARPPEVVDERAQKVLADARAALGGEATLSAIRSFTTTGRTRRVQGNNLVPIEFELLVELPDKYLRKDEIPAQESEPTTTGFNGGSLLQIPAPTPPQPRPGMPAPPAAQFEAMLRNRLVTARQDFARLMLGMFATSFASYPITFKYIGQAEAPEGTAHVLEGMAADNFKIRFFVDTKTSLPIMVSWTTPGRPMPAGRGAPGAPSSPGAATPPAASTSKPPPPAPEHRLYFADYREVDGIKLPLRLRRGIGANTTEETTFDRFRLNQKIDPRRFEVR
jgi:hypothetical protein